MHLVLQPLSMSSSITLCLHPPLLSCPPASHSSRLSEKLSPSNTLQMLSVCGGFHHCGERGLHCRASNSSVFARQRLPLLKKTPPKQLFNDIGSECVLMHVNHSVFLFMCVCACASIQLFMSTSRQLFDLVYCTSADSHFHPRCCAVNT